MHSLQRSRIFLCTRFERDLIDLATCSSILSPQSYPLNRSNYLDHVHYSIHSRAGSRSFSTSKSCQSLEPTEHTSSVLETKVSTAPKQPQHRAWRTYLRNRSLGKDASVIVLRDEGKKRKLVSNEHVVPQPSDGEETSTENLLTSINAVQKGKAKQEEVEKYMDKLYIEVRKQASHEGKVIDLETYERLTGQLGELFTRSQLAKYRLERSSSTKRNSHTNNLGPVSGTPSPIASDNLAWTSSWTPFINSTKSVHHSTDIEENKRKKPKLAAKVKLARQIIGSVWGFHTSESYRTSGSLQLNLIPEQLAFITTFEGSNLLSRVASKYNVEVDIARATESIVVIGWRSACETAAAEVQRKLAALQRFEIPQAALIKYFGVAQVVSIDLKTISALAGASSCVLSAAPRGSNYVLYSLNARNRSKLERSILSYLSECYERSLTRTLWPTQHEDRTSTLGIHSSLLISDLLPLQPVDRHKPWRRHTLPRTMSSTAEVQSDPTLHTTLEADLLSDLSDLVNRQNIAYNTAALTKLPSVPTVAPLSDLAVISLGYILTSRITDKKPNQVDDTTASSSEECRFSPATPGILKIFSTDSSPPGWKRGSSLTLSLIPEPLKTYGHGSEKDPSLPVLHLLFDLDTGNRGLELRQIKAVFRTEKIWKSLPALSTDIEISLGRQTQLKDKLLDQESLKRYIQLLRNAVAGYNKVEPPPDLTLVMQKSWLDRANDHYEAKGLEDLSTQLVQKYVPVQLQHHQTLSRELSPGCFLIYDEVSIDDTGNSYTNISLHGTVPYLTATEDVTSQLAIHASKVLQQLNGQQPSMLGVD